MKYAGNIFPFFCLLAVCGLFISCADDDGVPVRIAKFKAGKACAISYTYDEGKYLSGYPEGKKRVAHYFIPGFG